MNQGPLIILRDEEAGVAYVVNNFDGVVVAEFDNDADAMQFARENAEAEALRIQCEYS